METEGERESSLEVGFGGSVRSPRADDAVAIEKVLSKWLRPDECKHVRDLVEGSVAGKNDIRYAVAEAEGEILGLMGFLPLMQRASWRMTTDAESTALDTRIATNTAAELTNAYVADPRKGVGSALLDGLADIAVREGYSWMYVTSGASARDRAWPFYDQKFDARVGVRDDSQGNPVPIWVKHLVGRK